MSDTLSVKLGAATLRPVITDGYLTSLGAVSIGGTPVRNAAARFLPWFDSYQGEIFNRFQYVSTTQAGARTVIHTRVASDNDYPFRERRDSSGDLCFRTPGWDSAPQVAELRVLLEPASATLDGRAFTGFKYWFEVDSPAVPIHRLLDRQTWEVGGNLNDVSINTRNWLTPPRMKLERGTTYSTVGLDQWAGLLPGNMWGRWSLLPAFDLQDGAAGVLVGYFDEVSLIRTAIETNPGEDFLRHLDFHWFAQTTQARTNPKTILYCPDHLDEVDVLNLWTRLHDQERDKARRQFGITTEGPPQLVYHRNIWRGFRFDTSYEDMVEVAAEFGGELCFIDVVWEHQQALAEELHELVPDDKWKGSILEKFQQQNMCVTLDFEVARVHGGEAGLQALCARAAAKGLRVLSWMATHYSPNSALSADPKLGHGGNGIYAGRESGRHPDSGYPASCWTANLNAPIFEKMRGQFLGVCARTGLGGYLWDSYSNLGWWQVDYSKGDMRPQFDKMMQLYADLTKAGLYVMPEGLCAFSSHSCCGLHGGNVYAGERLGYSYDSNIALHYKQEGVPGEAQDVAMLRGQAPTALMFQCLAHRRVPNLGLHEVPRAEWDPVAAADLKRYFATYKELRPLMQVRTVLKSGAGVRWDNDAHTPVLFSFKAQTLPGRYVAALTGEEAVGGKLQANVAYKQVG